MAAADSKGVTQLLIDLGKGDESALNQLLPQIYGELHRLAAYYMNRERRDHTLQATALLHEAYLRLIDQRRVDWKNRAQFLGLAAGMMRRVLVNHARERAAARRGGGTEKITLTFEPGVFELPDLTVIALNDALEKLAQLDERKTRIIELKFFTGLTTNEIAEILDISSATVEREWKFSRAWLYNALRSRPDV
jgi:RNA polymerase sigma factor (TIGR02999 family)